MYKPPPAIDPKQAVLDSLRAKLRLLDRRIARMRKEHAGSTDPLVHRLIEYAIRERAEIRAKLP